MYFRGVEGREGEGGAEEVLAAACGSGVDLQQRQQQQRRRLLLSK
jgi:hypothetical protein